MQYEHVKSFIRREPFIPVDVVLNSGERIRVNKSEHVVFLDGRMVIGYPPPPKDDFPEGVVMPPYSDIAKIEPARRTRRATRPRRGKR